MKSILFIVNPNSAKGSEERISKAIESRINHSVFDLSISYTRSADHVVSLSKKAVTDKVDIIVAVGGDGTVNEVASQMLNTNSTLGIVPMGSGNGLARHLGISRNIEKAISLINLDQTTSIDTGSINGNIFVSIAGIGFDALVAKRFAAGNRRGFLGYFQIIAREFFKYKLQTYNLVFDNGMEINEKALFVAFANSNQFGYNTKIAPKAKLRDGLLDVCIVKKPKIWQVPVIAALILLRRVDISSSIKIVESKYLKLVREREGVVNIDGEAINFGKDLEIKINPLSLKIIINPYVSKV